MPLTHDDLEYIDKKKPPCVHEPEIYNSTTTYNTTSIQRNYTFHVHVWNFSIICINKTDADN